MLLNPVRVTGSSKVDLIGTLPCYAPPAPLFPHEFLFPELQSILHILPFRRDRRPGRRSHDRKRIPGSACHELSCGRSGWAGVEISLNVP